MNKILAHDFAEMSAPMLRLSEAKFLFEKFKEARSGAPNEGLFLLTVYFDAILFCLTSVEEMVDDETRQELRAIDSFLFFKALRNVATHHCVLSGLKGKFARPIARVVSFGVGCAVEFSEQFFFVPERLREVFDKVLAERPGERRTLESARRYLDRLEARGGNIMVVDAVESVIAEIEQKVM